MQLVKRMLILLLIMPAASLFAHFQMIYTPVSVIPEDAVSADFKVVFTHPFEAGHTMDIGKDESGEIKGLKEFFFLHQGVKTEISGLNPITFSSLENSASGFEFSFDREKGFKGGGDWAIIAVPHPYYEGSEDIYIQQVTKVMINKGGLATDWNSRAAAGYPEIIPLVKPYDVWTGGIFRGKVVDPAGNPVENAEIEFEYLNYSIDMSANKFTGNPALEKSGAGVIIADKQGIFEFIPPKSGYWGFAALGAGGEMQYNGKELSQDAVLWIEAQGQKETVKGSPKVSAASAEKKQFPIAVPIILIILVIAAVTVLPFVLKKKK